MRGQVDTESASLNVRNDRTVAADNNIISQDKEKAKSGQKPAVLTVGDDALTPSPGPAGTNLSKSTSSEPIITDNKEKVKFPSSGNAPADQPEGQLWGPKDNVQPDKTLRAVIELPEMAELVAAVGSNIQIGRRAAMLFKPGTGWRVDSIIAARRQKYFDEFNDHGALASKAPLFWQLCPFGSGPVNR